MSCLNIDTLRQEFTSFTNMDSVSIYIYIYIYFDNCVIKISDLINSDFLYQK